MLCVFETQSCKFGLYVNAVEGLIIRHDSEWCRHKNDNSSWKLFKQAKGISCLKSVIVPGAVDAIRMMKQCNYYKHQSTFLITVNLEIGYFFLFPTWKIFIKYFISDIMKQNVQFYSWIIKEYCTLTHFEQQFWIEEPQKNISEMAKWYILSHCVRPVVHSLLKGTEKYKSLFKRLVSMFSFVFVTS